MLCGLREGLPDWGEVFCVCHLHHVKQVREVCAGVIFRALIIFLIPTRLFSSRVSISSTATSLTVLAIRVPAARLILGSRPGRWLRSSWWRYWRRSASGRAPTDRGPQARNICWGRIKRSRRVASQ